MGWRTVAQWKPFCMGRRIALKHNPAVHRTPRDKAAQRPVTSTLAPNAGCS